MVSRMPRPPCMARVRLARVEDVHLIMDLVNISMAFNFRIACLADIKYLIENGVLSICQLDRDDEIVGFLSLLDYPLVPSVPPCAWEDFIWSKFKTIELNARNTLFIHLICWDPIYGRDVVENLLKSVFMHDPYVQHIAMVKSLKDHPNLIPNSTRPESLFRRVTVLEKGVPGDRLPVLCIADRKDISPRMKIRRAVEEDNDDIVPIIEAHSTTLRQIYGEFYISELISRHPESERVLLVCEDKEVAVGVMCLNAQINYESLEETFELSPFAGLRKLDTQDKQLPKKIGQQSYTSFTSTMNHLADTFQTTPCPSEDNVRYNLPAITVNEDNISVHDIDVPTYPVGPSHLDILLEDEDELEYDIVNIELGLLRVPELLSYEVLVSGLRPAESEDSIQKESDEKKKDKPKAPGLIQARDIEPRRYSGAPNAFLMELFAMETEYDERYSFDVLEVAFELFPDRDYCVICLPSNHTSFPLLEHFTLVTAYSCRLKYINETLYVAHVNSIRGQLKVRQGEAYDIPALQEVCEHAPQARVAMEMFTSSLSSYSQQSFVLLSEHQPVGMIIIEPLIDGLTLRTQYDLEPESRRPRTDSMILVGIMTPALEAHSRWFMRELLRQSKYYTLFWTCNLFNRGELSANKHLMSLTGHMAPVHPRRTMPNMTGYKNMDKIYKAISKPFALWVLERPLTSLPKVYVNSSIVVVGASRTGLAFIESLLLGPTSEYLTFSNVTLVSEHGVPTVSESLPAADICVPRVGRYNDRYLKSIPFYYYIDVMSAVMVGIDRKHKFIHLKGGGVKYYDELVLTCGLQFQHPDYLTGPLPLQKETESDKPCDRLLMDNPKYQPDTLPSPPEMPRNLILVNSLYEANLGLRRLLLMITDAKFKRYALSVKNPIIVYGDCIEAYCCLAALLELGIFPDMITFVEPFPTDDPNKLRVNCFNNETVDEKVQEKIKSFGIQVHRTYIFQEWYMHGSRIESVHFMSQLHSIVLPCFALFFYGLRAIDVNAFKAINECGLVYDGGLVVGTSFETNDPHVFGAGTCAKYSRHLYGNTQSHRYFSSEDVGEALAKMFLKKLDPFVVGTLETDLMPRYSSIMIGHSSKCASIHSLTRLSSIALKLPPRWQPVMKFESPLIQSAVLPGPLYYMKLREPGFEIPMEAQLCLPNQGHTLITNHNNNYFRLKLNMFHCIDAITCLSANDFYIDNMSQLYGKHEAFFNKLLTRFQLNLIPDLYEFFDQPWLSALYQENFQDLLRDINELKIDTAYNVYKSRASRLKSFDAKTANKEEAIDLGTFRSVMNKFVARKSRIKFGFSGVDVTSPCGQSEAIRADAAKFWQTIGGDAIILSHLTDYLDKNSVTNPHYAVAEKKIDKPRH